MTDDPYRTVPADARERDFWCHVYAEMAIRGYGPDYAAARADEAVLRYRQRYQRAAVETEKRNR